MNVWIMEWRRYEGGKGKEKKGVYAEREQGGMVREVDGEGKEKKERKKGRRGKEP